MICYEYKFLVILRKDKESNWGAEVVGAPIFSVGSTPKKALENFKIVLDRNV